MFVDRGTSGRWGPSFRHLSPPVGRPACIGFVDRRFVVDRPYQADVDRPYQESLGLTDLPKAVVDRPYQESPGLTDLPMEFDDRIDQAPA